MTAQQQLDHLNCPQLYWAILVESIWFIFWWCAVLSLDCFHKLCLSGNTSENSQVGWDIGNRMAKGYRFDAKWVCPMGTYAWGIQVFSSVREMRRHLIYWTEHLNAWDITFHGTDAFRVKPITPSHPIPKISTQLTILRGYLKDRVWKQSTEKRGHHQKRNQMDPTMFELLPCCHIAAQCMEWT